MRPLSKFLLPAVAASLTLAACGSSSSGSSSSSSTASSSQGSAAAVVRTASNATLGSTVLTNAQGLTLYSLSAEQGGKFICVSSCTQLWHPLTASASGTPAGAASLGTVTRPEGTRQVTYKGLPLYTFAQDQRPGEAKGQGVKDVGIWSAATVGSTGAATSTGSSTSAPARSGY
jgi:predicted lipoprotein with Yx(FWY)xxD motif